MRGRSTEWYATDILQLIKPKKKKGEKPKELSPLESPPEEIPQTKHKCEGCKMYDPHMDFCYEKAFSLEVLTYCPLGKWEEEGPF
jgi:hypothetical protein